MKKIVVCDDDPSFATATAHLLFVGLDTLAKGDKRFEQYEVRVLGKTDGWSPFVLDFYGECSISKNFVGCLMLEMSPTSFHTRATRIKKLVVQV
ncbi:MAG: hypothetical protein EBQ54_07935 [Actinobacteria bacterium]|nr:hypothetical protein [Actinomycetota bacterium]